MKEVLIKQINSALNSLRGIQEVSLSMIAIDTLGLALRSEKFDKQIIDMFILKGDEQIRSCISQNPYITKGQWMKLLIDKSKVVSDFAKLNTAFDNIDMSEKEREFIKNIKGEL